MNIRRLFQKLPYLLMGFVLFNIFPISMKAQKPGPSEAKLMLAGNYADPSILKYDNAYYLTHQSGKYRPGLLIWKSEDLKTWKPLTYALTNFEGNVWAPDLVEYKKKFYLYFIAIYNGKYENFVVTADHIEGPWSEAKSIGVSGQIDPGHVVDTDGKRYLHFWEGLVVELSDDGLHAASQPKKVMDGWPIPKDWAIECFCLESPKLTHLNDWYYLTAAQGGTVGPSTSHMATSFRSKTALGPWEISPYNPVIHTWSREEKWWSKGHGTLVEGPDGQWFMVIHGIKNNYRTLGRSTLLEPIDWDENGWFYVPEKWPEGWQEPYTVDMPLSDDFEAEKLGIQWQFFDKFEEDRIAFADRSLVMRGKGSDPGNSYPLTLVPRDEAYEIEAEVEVSGNSEGGMMLFVSEKEYVGLSLNAEGQVKRRLKNFKSYNATDEPIIKSTRVKFKIVNQNQDVRFYLKPENGDWQLMQPSLEVSGNGIIRPALFVIGDGKARFSYFKYTALNK